MKRFGLLGEKLGHSFSKEIHEIFFKLTGKEASYDMIERKPEELPGLLDEVKKGEYNGINVTIPYKIEVMKYLDEVSSIAKKIGAVNTITYRNRKLIGDNSDYYGFLKTLELNDINIENSKILILGTGGASKSIYSVLTDKGAEKIYVATILENDSFKIRQQDRLIHYSEIKNLMKVNLIVNCTPVGMYPELNMCPLKDNDFIETENLIDIIYNPEETVLMKKYREKGAKVINGLMMLVSQAIKSEEIWNNEEYDGDILDKIYKNLAEKLYK